MDLTNRDMNALSRDLDIVVLLGGWSNERDVSLTSGSEMMAALKRLGFSPRAVDPAPDMADFIAQLTPKPDLVLNGLHGKWGEDGRVQSLLDMMGIAYSHSNALTSALAMDKELTKQLLSAHGLPVPMGQVIKADRLMNYKPIPRPFVIKPVNEGSSVGVFVIKDGDEMPDLSMFKSQDLLVEEYISGREFTTSVLGNKALGVTELRPKSGFYDYHAKYTDGATDHIFPAPIAEHLQKRMLDFALCAHQILRCEGISRSDFRYDEHGGAGVKGRLVILEVNTQPGMTQLSLVPEQAKHLGMDFDQLVYWMVDDALTRYRQKNG